MTTPPGDGEGEDDRVGYRNPPKHSQFQKGRSGNPKGRPKGTRNLKTELHAELAEQILVREGDRTKKVTKLRAMVKALLAKALKGDVRAIAQIDTMSLRPSEADGPRTFADLMRLATQSDPRNEDEVEKR
jgi:Family of unknown function (DUF5681)